MNYQDYIAEIATFASTSGLTAYLGYKIKDWFIAKKTNKFKMQNHQLFNQLKKARTEVNNWNVPENKTVLKVALKIKLNEWYSTGIELAKEIDSKDFKFKNSYKIESKIIDWAENTINEYSKKWHDKGIDTELIRIINNKHQTKVELFLNALNRIAHDEVYLTWKLKYIAIFESLNVLLAETKNDFLTLIQKEFNGKTKNIKYKGIPINEKEYENWKKDKI